jgi:hypothetical protein
MYSIKHKITKQKEMNTLAYNMVTHLISDPVQNNHIPVLLQEQPLDIS